MALSSRIKPNDQDQAKQRLDDSSAKNRNLFTGFMAVLLYTLVMTLAISDEDLLMNRMSMKLPLIDLGLKPTAWFVVVPILLLMLHADLLHNLDEHLAKLKRWQALNGGKIDARDLQPFFFDFAFARCGQGLIGWLLDWMVWLTIYQLPLVVILVVQVRFGVYQNVLLSILHFSQMVIDFALCIWFYLRIHRAKGEVFWRKRSLLAAVLFGLTIIVVTFSWEANLDSDWNKNMSWLIPAELIALNLLFAIFERIFCSAQIFLLGVFSLMLTIWFSNAWQVIDTNKFIDDKLQNPNLSALLPRLQVKNRILINVDDNEKRALQMLADYKAAGKDGVPAKSTESPTQSATDDGNHNRQVAKQWWQKGQRLDWQDRSLNYADLSGCLMARVNLAHARLQGANLAMAQLQGANLSGSQLQGAYLLGVQLQRANLNGAQLQDADLSLSQLQDAGLRESQLQGAHLSGSQLQGADLSRSQLQGADLSRSQLQGADLSRSQLQGADLSTALLQGADLNGAQMQGADLHRSQMQGAGCPWDSPRLTLKQRLVHQQSHHASLYRCDARQFAALPPAQIDRVLGQIPNLDAAKQDEMSQRLSRPANLQDAKCGELSQAMLADIERYWDSEVPEEISDQWRETSLACDPARLQGAAKNTGQAKSSIHIQ